MTNSKSWFEFDGRVFEISKAQLALVTRTEGEYMFRMLWLECNVNPDRLLRLEQVVLASIERSLDKARLHVLPDETCEDDSLGTEPCAEWDTSGWSVGTEEQWRFEEAILDFERIAGDRFRINIEGRFVNMDTDERATGRGVIAAELAERVDLA